MAVAIRCKHLGLAAALALALSVSAATDWPTADAGASAKDTQAAPAAVVLNVDDAPPVPAPLLFLAGGLLGLVAYLRWRQRARDKTSA